jgi:hypothetical protein
VEVDAGLQDKVLVVEGLGDDLLADIGDVRIDVPFAVAVRKAGEILGSLGKDLVLL